MSLLQKIADVHSGVTIDASDVAVVIAHPDDETIGCGALLSRLANVSIVVITDGAPRSGADALRAGFASPSAYADARARELRTALAVAGVDSRQIIELGVPDQAVCRSLVTLSRRLASLFESKGIATVLTHAFEGGHPDHDGAAFCVRAAAALLGKRAPTIVEMPLYHLSGEGMVTQRFCDGEDEIVAHLSPDESRIKTEMMTAHMSQAETLRLFNASAERYRTARAYDFRSLPNKGKVLYSQHDFGFFPDEWTPLATEALSAMGLVGRGDQGGRSSRPPNAARKDAPAMNIERIHDYIAAELQNEIRALEGRIASLEAGPAKSSFLAYKLKELYWTVTRLCGLGHLHEGLPPEDSSLVNSKRNPLLFPASTRASAGGVNVTAPGERLLIDVTDTLRCNFVSGIQRVVRQLAKAAMDSGAGIPVFIQDGEFFSYLRDSSTLEKVEVAKGDKFIMADASWNDVRACQAAMEMTSRKGGSNILILHDIHPLLYPGLFHPDNVKNVAIWFDEVALKADALVAVSRSAAEEFLAYVAANAKPISPKMQVGWQHLGADFEIESDDVPSQHVASICAGESPFFLSVSTLEPKKGYTVALDALDRLWASGVDVRYVIVGRYGWNTRALEHRICSHREYNKRLFWLGQISAVDLKHLYRSAHSLIFASVAEGFGLPLIEAAHFGLPAIASDIPVFREIGGDAISYFQVGDGESLAGRLREALANRRSEAALPRILKWQEATDALLKLITTNAYQFGSRVIEAGAPVEQNLSKRSSARAMSSAAKTSVSPSTLAQIRSAVGGAAARARF